MLKKLRNIFIVRTQLKSGSKKKFVFSFTLQPQWNGGSIFLFASVLYLQGLLTL